MPDFVYTARNVKGNNISGKLTANTKKEVLDALARQSLFALSVEDAKKGHIEIKLFQKKPPEALIAATLEQLADLLQNGVSILEAFKVLVNQTRNATFKAVLTDIYDRIAEGESVDAAFAVHDDVFNDLTISIVRAGSEGAFLEDSLRRVAKFLEQANELKSKIVGAMIYPGILCTAGTIMVLVLLTFFVPRFQTFFDQAERNGGTLPFATTSLIAGNALLKKYGLYAFGGLVVIVFFVRYQMKTAYGRRLMDRLKLKIPLMGEIILNSAVSRFCRVFGTLLENGVPILRSLEISSSSTGNTILSDAINRAAESVSSGETLSKPLGDAKIMPPQVMAMISIAEESNTLESVLVNAADNIERQVRRKLEMLVRFIEPGLLLLMAAAVLYIVVGLLLPIFSMGANI